jgi:hypothetical protein
MVILVNEKDILRILNYKDIYSLLINAFKSLKEEYGANSKRLRTVFLDTNLTYSKNRA